MKTAFVALLVIHGAIHLLGFVKGFGFAEISQLTGPMSRPLGVLWLFAALSFFASATLFSMSSRDWAIAAVPALILSQILILTSWSDAKFGTVANLIVVVPVIFSFVADLKASPKESTRNRSADAQLLRAS